MPEAEPSIEGLLVVPRLRIQNANAISSPLTWGFPAMTAFGGAMHALERKLPEHIGLTLERVGVVCHHFEAQATDSGYPRTFHLTRNPVDKKGETASIVEEGRAHLEITLVFGVGGEAVHTPNEYERDAVAREISGIIEGMRIAGGSVLPPPDSGPSARFREPALIALDVNDEERLKQFRRLRRQWLPGFALVSRDDLLRSRLDEMQREDRDATALDAWLDLSRLNIEPAFEEAQDPEAGERKYEGGWTVRRPPGWIVPIPVGYAALSPLQSSSEVARTRDSSTPFRFVESLYSLGQWISPHRLRSPSELLWYTRYDEHDDIYRCCNDFAENAATF